MVPNTPDTLTQAFAILATELERDIDTRGWDQPASLWVFGLETVDLDPGSLLAATGTSGHGTFSLKHVTDLYGDPVDAIVGTHAADEVLGALIICEGYTYPDDVTEGLKAGEFFAAELGPPSEHPRRVEIRQVFGLLRDGYTVAVSRTRGIDDVIVHDDVTIGGRMVDTIRSYLKTPVQPDVDTPRQVYTVSFLNAAAEFVVAVLSHNNGGDDEMRRELGQFLCSMLDAVSDETLADFVAGTPLEEIEQPPAAGTTWDDVRNMLRTRVASGHLDEEHAVFLDWADDVTLANTLGAGVTADDALATLRAVLDTEHVTYIETKFAELHRH